MAEEDFTMGRVFCLVPVLPDRAGDITRGLGVVGSTETLGVTGRLRGPDEEDEVELNEDSRLFGVAPPMAAPLTSIVGGSSEENENFGRMFSLFPCKRLLR